MSSTDLMRVFSNDRDIIGKGIISLKMGVKSRTGEQFAKATTSDGTTYIKTVTRNGVATDTRIQIPSYFTKEDRDNIIIDLYRQGYVQDDIADMLEISQGTVSNVLRGQKR